MNQLERLLIKVKTKSPLPGNAWVSHNRSQVYYRVGPRVFEHEFVNCIQIANVSVLPKFRRRGEFKRILNSACRVAARHGWAVSVDQVQSKVLRAYMESLGWKVHSIAEDQLFSPSFYNLQPVAKKCNKKGYEYLTSEPLSA